ncbi:hypothetical protein [Aureivirga sp. CE67]|uniref:hypothetical protein n=1 Tax=Aureivirga sp. CE67 TaxID=1788983 RepID=UPI0018CAAA08|nr:hypothetical protein [Aureivirga sp. CE67]
MKKGYVKIIECFDIPGMGMLAELQHYENGIPPNTEIIDLETENSWFVKKRVYHGILISDESETYFDCETESMQVDNSFSSLSDRKNAIKKELNKRKKGIYFYLLKFKTTIHKEKAKPEIGMKLKILKNG